ncbi:MAG TPA: hypothetical protein PKA88_12465, partial [Polyangiaceae bacterium]|nr:hypothetical protein [Polyangiaceae bacterium]
MGDSSLGISFNRATAARRESGEPDAGGREAARCDERTEDGELGGTPEDGPLAGAAPERGALASAA